MTPADFTPMPDDASGFDQTQPISAVLPAAFRDSEGTHLVGYSRTSIYLCHSCNDTHIQIQFWPLTDLGERVIKIMPPFAEFRIQCDDGGATLLGNQLLNPRVYKEEDEA